ncbi:Thiolase-like subgroup [Penicillium cf. griseofulvum]|nr:Thiolase-like subgroup [Penicillium cf. griseofulvum]
MANSGDPGRGPGSLVDASGYTFTDKDTKPGKIKVKKTSKASTKKKADGTAPGRVFTGIDNTNKHTDAKDGPIDTSPTASPLPTLDSKVVSVFPTGKPREDDLLETVICKHCKRPTLKQTAADHVRGCLKAKQEKARKKKEARDAANRLKAGDDRDDDGPDKADGDNPNMGQKSAKRAPPRAPRTESKKKKKKDEPKQKTAKPKGPVDVEKQCGVTLPNGAQCARSLTCKSHSMGAKRSVPGRTLPYDMLLQQYQKKNQARQQKAAIDANAPLQEDIENTGPIDSDEERDSVMAAIARSAPQPLVRHPIITTKSKYRYVRIKEQMSHAMGVRNGGGLFSNDDSQPLFGGILFSTVAADLDSSSSLDANGEADVSAGGMDAGKRSTVPGGHKTPVTSAA